MDWVTAISGIRNVQYGLEDAGGRGRFTPFAGLQSGGGQNGVRMGVKFLSGERAATRRGRRGRYRRTTAGLGALVGGSQSGRMTPWPAGHLIQEGVPNPCGSFGAAERNSLYGQPFVGSDRPLSSRQLSLSAGMSARSAMDSGTMEYTRQAICFHWVTAPPFRLVSSDSTGHDRTTHGILSPDPENANSPHGSSTSRAGPHAGHGRRQGGQALIWLDIAV